jgi:hypothetical protein
MSEHDFDIKARDGAIVENKIGQSLALLLNDIFLCEFVRRITWDENNNFSRIMQRDGIDGLITKRSLKYDAKIREFAAYRYEDILIETISMVETGARGWYYKETDLIFYGWKNEIGTSIMDMYILLLQNLDLREWFAINNQYFETVTSRSYSNGHHWTTENIAVPIIAFPKDVIIRVPKQKLPALTDFM